ncbi:immunity 49 family protein [Kitasatospora sp. NPDC051853]|uniref:immunity 49 family protein n=1 Tax=Kitasatospora sp. NPDC051853 TaxID=3364058 RepID=UPI003795AC60
MIVARHEVVATNAESVLGKMHRYLAMWLGTLGSQPLGAYQVMDTAVTIAEMHTLTDPKADRIETWDAFLTAMQASSALFTAAGLAEGAAECRIAGEVRTIPAGDSLREVHAANWLAAFWLCIVCRETERLDALAAVPVELLRESGAVYDEYIYVWVEALQAYWRKEPQQVEKLAAAIEGSDPEVARIASKDYLLRVAYPPMEMFYQFLKDDQAAFNASLVQALELHKEYWTGDRELSIESTGFLALAPLAVACMAYDSGMQIDVESGYLPENLLDRSWIGEYETT